jgi:DNA modification methylase
MIQTGDHWTILQADVFDGLRSIEGGSVHCVVTSPPYWGLRDYGYEGQIGLEDTPEQFVAKMVGVCREIRRVLRDDGVMFLNLGDSYSKDSKYGGVSGSKNLPQFEAGAVPRGYRASGLANGNLVGIPWRVALALQEDGWILRQNIIWAKPSHMPESISGTRWVRCRNKVRVGVNADVIAPGSFKAVATQNGKANRHCVGGEWLGAAEFEDCPGCDKCRENGGMVLRKGSWRPTTSHEFIFQFVKSQAYFCDGDGSKEPASGTAHSRGSGVNPKAAAIELTSARNGQPAQNPSKSAAICGLVETRNMRSVWTMSSEAYKEAHFACYPTKLVHRCLLAATSRGGCCSACGSQYAPVVESKRTATRPGKNTKVPAGWDTTTGKGGHGDIHKDGRTGGKREAAIAEGSRPGRPDHPNLVGNRDPQRHTTTTVVTGYLPTCTCNAPVGRPVVLDPFSGSGTTGQVAINMGCDYIGLEAKPEYVALQIKRLNTPWKPKEPGKKRSQVKRRKHQLQRELF